MSDATQKAATAQSIETKLAMPDNRNIGAGVFLELALVAALIPLFWKFWYWPFNWSICLISLPDLTDYLYNFYDLIGVFIFNFGLMWLYGLLRTKLMKAEKVRWFDALPLIPLFIVSCEFGGVCILANQEWFWYVLNAFLEYLPYGDIFLRLFLCLMMGFILLYAAWKSRPDKELLRSFALVLALALAAETVWAYVLAYLYGYAFMFLAVGAAIGAVAFFLIRRHQQHTLMKASATRRNVHLAYIGSLCLLFSIDALWFVQVISHLF